MSLDTNKKLFIVMGVSGSGKSTLAQRLASNLSAQFIEADEYHSLESKKMMSQGEPITESQRAPWVNRLCEVVEEKFQHNNRCVVAFSGLKYHHRQLMRQVNVDTQFIFLNTSFTTIKSRIYHRQAHFFNPSLLSSQFDELEAPINEDDVIVIDNSLTIEQTLTQILNRISN